MALDIFDLQAVLTLDDNPFNQAINRSKASASSFGAHVGQVANAVANAAGIMAAAFGGIALLGIYNAAKDQASLAQLKVALDDAKIRATSSFDAMAAASNHWATVNNDSAKQLKPLEAAVKSTQEALERQQFQWDHATKTVKGHTEAAHANGVALAWAKQQYEEATSALAAASGQHQVWVGDLTSGLQPISMTVEGLQQMARAFEDSSSVSHIAIQDVEAQFLRYGVTSQDVMSKSVQAVLDLAAATGDSLPAAAMKLGEAYKNPAQELSRLQALGIIFDANTQKQIKSMTAAGDSADAFNLILQALNNTYGGAAAAAADTFNGKLAQLQNKFNDLTESIGNALLPVLTQIVTSIKNFLDRLTPEQMDLFAKAVLALTAAFTGLFVIGKITSLISLFGTTLLPILAPVAAVVGGVAGALTILAAASGDAGGFFNGLIASIQNLWNIIQTDFGPIIDDVKGFLAEIQGLPTGEQFITSTRTMGGAKQSGGTQFGEGSTPIKISTTYDTGKSPTLFDNIIKALNDGKDKFIADVGKLLSDAFDSVFGKIQIGSGTGFSGLKGIFDSINISLIQPVVQGIKDFINDLSTADWSGIGKLVSAIGQIAGVLFTSGIAVAGPLLKTILDGLGTVLKTLVDIISDAVNGNWGKFFTDLGQGVMDLVKGLAGGAVDLIKGLATGIAQIIGAFLGMNADDIKKNVEGIFSALGSAVSDFVSKLGPAIGNIVTGIGNTIHKFVNSIVGSTIKALANLIEGIRQAFYDFASKFSGALGFLHDALVGLADDLIDVENQLNAAAIAANPPDTANYANANPQSSGHGSVFQGGVGIAQRAPGSNTVNNFAITIQGSQKNASQLMDDFINEAQRRNMKFST